MSSRTSQEVIDNSSIDDTSNVDIPHLSRLEDIHMINEEKHTHQGGSSREGGKEEGERLTKRGDAADNAWYYNHCSKLRKDVVPTNSDDESDHHRTVTAAEPAAAEPAAAEPAEPATSRGFSSHSGKRQKHDDAGKNDNSVIVYNHTTTTDTEGHRDDHHIHDTHHSRNETHEPHEHTTSVNRSFSDLDPIRFVFFVVLLAALRTLIQHPFNLALARKQAIPSCAAQSTREVLQTLIKREGYVCGLQRGMVGLVGGNAASEGIYLVAFEALREFLPISYDVWREMVSGYAADAACRFVHIPLMVVAYRQMVFEGAVAGGVEEKGEPEGESKKGEKVVEELPVGTFGASSSTEEALLPSSSAASNGEADASTTSRVVAADDRTAAMSTATTVATVATASGSVAAAATIQNGRGSSVLSSSSSVSKPTSSTFPFPKLTTSTPRRTSQRVESMFNRVSKRQKENKARDFLFSRSPTVATVPKCSTHVLVVPSLTGMTALVYREGGVRSLYAGLGTTLLIGCQWSGVWWAMYGYLKTPLYGLSDRMLVGWDDYDEKGRRIKARQKERNNNNNVESTGGNHDGNGSDDRNFTIGMLKTIQTKVLPSSLKSSFTHDDNMLINGVASVAASGITAVIFNPFLVIRTKMQVTSGLTLRAAVRDIYYEGFSGGGGGEGMLKGKSVDRSRARGSVRGFFRGLYLNVSLCVVDGVLATLCYEYSKLWSDRSHLRGGNQ